MKVCSNSPKQNENFGKVEPGLNFREKKFNYSSILPLCFLNQSYSGCRSLSQHLLGKEQECTRTGRQCGFILIQSPIQSSVASLHQWLKKRRKGAVYLELEDISQTTAVVLSSSYFFNKSQHLKARMKTRMELILLMIYNAHGRLWCSLCKKHIQSPWGKNYISVFLAKHVFKFLCDSAKPLIWIMYRIISFTFSPHMPSTLLLGDPFL